MMGRNDPRAASPSRKYVRRGKQSRPILRMTRMLHRSPYIRRNRHRDPIPVHRRRVTVYADSRL